MAWIRERKENYRDIFERGFRVTELPTAVWSWRFERGRQKASSLYTLRLRVYIDERKLTTSTQSTNFSCGVLETGLIPTLSHLRPCVDDFFLFSRSLSLSRFFFYLPTSSLSIISRNWNYLREHFSTSDLRNIGRRSTRVGTHDVNFTMLSFLVSNKDYLIQQEDIAENYEIILYRVKKFYIDSVDARCRCIPALGYIL